METGQWVMTKGVSDAVASSAEFSSEIVTATDRYNSNDWGDLCDEDKQMNDDAVKSNKDRVFASYKTSKGKVYIITEWDRSVTTILFANEY